MRARLRGVFEPEEHRQGMGLAVEGQTPGEQHRDIGRAKLEAVAGRGALVGREDEILGMDAERDQRQLRQGEAGRADALAQVLHLGFEHER